MRRTFWIILLVIIACSFLMSQEVKKMPARYTDPSSGSAMYKAYCASCHGVDGKGSGPASVALKATLPDLTQLAKKNGGKYPSDHVHQIILGDSMVPAHGDKQMPVWGPAFLHMDSRDRSVLALRVKNLTDHIGTLQAK